MEVKRGVVNVWNFEHNSLMCERGEKERQRERGREREERCHVHVYM